MPSNMQYWLNRESVREVLASLNTTVVPLVRSNTESRAKVHAASSGIPQEALKHSEQELEPVATSNGALTLSGVE